MANLALKYRPSTFEDVVEQNNVVTILESMCKQPELPNRNFLLVGPRGCGKAQPLTSLVLTTQGYMTMGQIEVGSEVFTHTGAIAKVSEIFDQGERDVYQITFDDNTSIEVADNHLNLVWSHNPMTGDTQDAIVPTIELKSYYEKLKRDFPYNHYLGVRIPAVNWDEEDIDFSEVSDEELLSAFSEFKTEYFLSSRKTRLNLLKAVLNYSLCGEGNISDLMQDGQIVMFTNPVDTAFNSSLSFLIRSLGCKDTVVPKFDSCRHVIDVSTDIAEELFGSLFVTQAPKYITSITYVGKKECRCIMVDHDDHTYITDGFTPTHNTTLGRIVASTLNEGQGSPIELDAASNSGVDTVRDIVSQAHLYPIGTKYKVFICDECFPGNHWVHTPSGQIQIKDIQEGDRVYNMTGSAMVKRVFRNRVKTENLVFLRLSNKHVITTKDHLFFTDRGWVAAKNLKKNEVLYDYSEMCGMRKGISSSVYERRENSLQQRVPENMDASEECCSVDTIRETVSNLWENVLDDTNNKRCNLWNEVRAGVEKRTQKYGAFVQGTCSALAYVYMSCLWERDGNSEQRSSDSVFSEMRKSDSWEETQEGVDQCLRMVWKFIRSELECAYKENLQQGMSICADSFETSRGAITRIFETDESEQSDVQSEECKEDARYKSEEWDIAHSACNAWWKRPIYSTSDSSERSVGRNVDIRISGENRYNEGQQSESLSYSVQTRPRLSGIDVGNRGGWCRPQFEISTIAGRKESKMFGKSRVEGVTFYQPGNNEQLFSSSFTDTELHSEYVELYDLEVDGHPSYYINDILVHNCHSFSTAAWQSLLLTLEEQPAKSVFILLTTNPEKIPATILSRVQKFQLSNISLHGLESRLKHVIECENQSGQNITYTDDAISYIAKLAKGGMRDALTLLDKALVYSNEITSENLKYSLDIPEYDDYFNLLNAYAKKESDKIMDIVGNVYESGTNFVKWFEGFQSFVINIAKYVFLQDINKTMIPSYYIDKVENYTASHAKVCLQLSQLLVEMIAKISRTEYMEEVAISYLCSRR